jgi:hypothetical protein
MNDVGHVQPIDWDFIVETIRDERCILFLGSEIFNIETEKVIEDRLLHYIGYPDNSDIQDYYSTDHLFLFNSRASKTKGYYKIRSFYNQLQEKAAQKIFEKLADIPFHFVINTTPDASFTEVLKQKNIRHQAQYYWKKRQPNNSVGLKMQSSNPLVYNLLGSVERQESLILTHNDLFEYLESVFSGSSFPEKLKKSLKEANNFIFLGIPFERWYMQLLLRILYVHNDFNFVRYASNQQIDEEVKAFCYDQFHIEFVSTNISGFVNQLYEKCLAKGVIRELKEDLENPIKNIRNLLVKDDIKEALEQLRDYLFSQGGAAEDLIDDLTLLSNKHNRLSKRIRQNIIGHQEAEIMSNKFRLEMLELLKEAENL